MKRNFIVNWQARPHQGITPKGAYPQTTDQTVLYPGQACINMKVNFIIAGTGGDIPEQVLVENRGLGTGNVQKWWKFSTPWRRF